MNNPQITHFTKAEEIVSVEFPTEIFICLVIWGARAKQLRGDLPGHLSAAVFHA